MKDISTILLASVFVLFSLIVLISAASNPDRTSSTLDNDQQRVSDLGLRFAFKRWGYTEVHHTQRPLLTGYAQTRPKGILNRV
jgi:hypothetical protein